MRFTRDNAVKCRPSIAKAVLSCAERSEVFRGLGHIICEPVKCE